MSGTPAVTPMWKEMMQAIYGDNEGFAVLAYGGSGLPWKQRFYHYPDKLDSFLEDAEYHSSYTNIYFCPHLFTGKNKRKESAAPVQALWMDKDEGPVKDIKPKPTYCWMTSEGKHHALWLLNKPTDPEEAEIVVRYITYTTPGADRGCWNLGRVIRFPGSTNYKYYPPEEGELLWNNGPTYDISELEPKQKSEMEHVVEKLAEEGPPPLPKKVPSFTDAVIAYGQRIPSTVWSLLREVPGPLEDWSGNLWKMERMLLEADVPPIYTFAIVRDSPWNKYKRDSRPEKQLWEEIHKANLEKGPYQETPETLPWVSLDELMLYSERPTWMVEGIWMEKNVGWIAGVGKSYKTIISLDLALSVAAGVPFLGKYPVVSEGPVLIVQEEDPVWRVAHRVQVMSQQKGISNLSLSRDNRSLVLEIKENKVPLYISVGGGLLFKDSSRMDQLAEAIEKYRPKLVLLDPLFMISAGLDEFKTGEMAESLNILKHWRNKFECAISVVHHYRKSTGTAVERLYGSQALYAWSENNLFVSRIDGEDNSVVVDRDIKDSKRSEGRIKVTFHDIDDIYMFETEPDEHSVSGTLVKRRSGGLHDKILELIRAVPKGGFISKQDIIRRTGAHRNTVTKAIANLELEGKVTTQDMEGQTTVSPTDTIYGADPITDILEDGVMI